jgi:hypothetical protein
MNCIAKSVCAFNIKVNVIFQEDQFAMVLLMVPKYSQQAGQGGEDRSRVKRRG